jgi:hypothetical protein
MFLQPRHLRRLRGNPLIIIPRKPVQLLILPEPRHLPFGVPSGIADQIFQHLVLIPFPGQQLIQIEQVRNTVEKMVGGPDVSLDKCFVYYLPGSSGVCVVPLSSFATKMQGFRITLPERLRIIRLQPAFRRMLA